MLQFTHRKPIDEAVLGATNLALPIVRRVATVHTQGASRLSWHHHDFVEVLIVVGGATSYEFRDGKRFDLIGGQFLVIPAGVEHRGVNNVRSPARLSGIMVDPHCRTPLKKAGWTERDAKKILHTLNVSTVRAAPCGTLLQTMARHLDGAIRAVQQRKEYARSHLRLLLCQVLIELALQIDHSLDSQPLELIDKAISFMRTHQGDEYRLDDLAAHANCSRAQLFKVFKKETGMTPNDFWKRIRIETAQDLLRTSDRTITDIAMTCGFTTSQYFSSVFRNYIGVTPREYRRLAKSHAASSDQTAN